jgi:hypothetical protein
MPEPWLRNTHTAIPAIPRQVLHALELTAEDAARWTSTLSEAELHATPHTLPSVSFQLRHIARSLDRLLTYAEGNALSETQLAALRTEHDPTPGANKELQVVLKAASTRVLALPLLEYEHSRYVGRHLLPTTLGALIVHCADHTQRHSGQLVTTAKLLLALR